MQIFFIPLSLVCSAIHYFFYPFFFAVHIKNECAVRVCKSISIRLKSSFENNLLFSGLLFRFKTDIVLNNSLENMENMHVFMNIV